MFSASEDATFDATEDTYRGQLRVYIPRRTPHRLEPLDPRRSRPRRSFTRGEVITPRRLDASHGGLTLGFQHNN